MIQIFDKSTCSGCHACVSACRQNAIEMAADEEGFLYPKIDKSICTNCGACETMCQAIRPIYKQRTPIAYACWNRDEFIKESSSSGGVFYAVAKWIISQGGVVFGAAFNDNLELRHISIESVDRIPLMQGSKYLQSVIGDAFKRAKDFLDDGRYVLFTGTPCQIDGLLHYLRKDYERLYTQDIICHGVPSPEVWKKYLEYQTHRFNSTLSKDKLPSFRQKTEGWKRYSVSLNFENDVKYSVYHREDCYMRAFLKNLSLRPSCFECRSKTKSRNSDITLADFWGIENVEPEMFNDKGVSLVLANSDKGKKLFDAVKEDLIFREVDFEAAVSHNTSAFRSAPRPENREAFFNRFRNEPFDLLVNELSPQPVPSKLTFIQRLRRKARIMLAKLKQTLVGEKRA